MEPMNNSLLRSRVRTDLPGFGNALGSSLPPELSNIDATSASALSAPMGDGFESKFRQVLKGEPSPQEDDKLKRAFHDFVGQTLFAQMIASMRSTQEEPAYFHGGRAEKIFQGQLDQALTEEISNASSEMVAGPMYELFQLRRAP